MKTPTKMMVMDTAEEAQQAQQALGDDWYVTTYARGRVGQRVDTLIFCPLRRNASERERSEADLAVVTILHALRPGGSYVRLR